MEPLLAVRVVGVVGLAVRGRFVRREVSRLRAIEEELRQPARSTAEATEGTGVRLRGRVVTAAGHESLLLGMACVYSWLMIAEPSVSTAGTLRAPERSVVFDRQAGIPTLETRDESGTATVVLESWQLIRNGSGRPASREQRARFVTRERLRGDGWIASLQGAETVVTTGDEISVLGVAHSEEGSEPDGYRGTRKRLVLRAPAKGELWVDVGRGSAGRPR